MVVLLILLANDVKLTTSISDDPVTMDLRTFQGNVTCGGDLGSVDRPNNGFQILVVALIDLSSRGAGVNRELQAIATDGDTYTNAVAVTSLTAMD